MVSDRDANGNEQYFRFINFLLDEISDRLTECDHKTCPAEYTPTGALLKLPPFTAAIKFIVLQLFRTQMIRFVVIMMD